ncbi:hypothetical protein Z969_04850 [Clostridium novyi A str. 4570]|uniref:Zinc-ribbon domain-containing protein n=1 Tax=Clostridium novyi A str. 4570 TaxID=1444290 RepID=A0AA88ZQE7_CLONO|nr:zinc ribbon domain-containing protein [Clostridium novyi]KGN02598.1 hypothetical protein Z969_04850 [Clostridium novyi A str. 4570]
MDKIMENIVGIIFLNFLIVLTLALITREFWCWWFKQNKIVKLLEDINNKLEKTMNNEQSHTNIQNNVEPNRNSGANLYKENVYTEGDIKGVYKQYNSEDNLKETNNSNEVKEEIICECGKKLNKNDKFCMNCGKKLKE